MFDIPLRTVRKTPKSMTAVLIAVATGSGGFTVGTTRGITHTPPETTHQEPSQADRDYKRLAVTQMAGVTGVGNAIERLTGIETLSQIDGSLQQVLRAHVIFMKNATQPDLTAIEALLSGCPRDALAYRLLGLATDRRSELVHAHSTGEALNLDKEARELFVKALEAYQRDGLPGEVDQATKTEFVRQLRSNIATETLAIGEVTGDKTLLGQAAAEFDDLRQHGALRAAFANSAAAHSLLQDFGKAEAALKGVRVSSLSPADKAFCRHYIGDLKEMYELVPLSEWVKNTYGETWDKYLDRIIPVVCRTTTPPAPVPYAIAATEVAAGAK